MCAADESTNSQLLMCRVREEAIALGVFARAGLEEALQMRHVVGVRLGPERGAHRLKARVRHARASPAA